MSRTIVELYDDLRRFFEIGLLTHEPIVSKRNRSYKAVTREWSLFEHMTSGRGAELRAQHALYPYLLEKYPDVCREYKFGQTFIDFFIPSLDGGSVAIELKHYSPHQSGQFAHLLGPSSKKKFSIADDMEKKRPDGSILVQIGLYTAVEEVDNVDLRGSHSRFVRTYVSRAVAQDAYELNAHSDLSKWTYLNRYVSDPATPVAFTVPYRRHEFGSPNDKVRGRVCFFLTVAK